VVKEEWVIGAEEDTMSYVEHMVKIMKNVKRVLNPNGSLWLNLEEYYEGKFIHVSCKQVKISSLFVILFFCL
jgi:hypothetical protein